MTINVKLKNGKIVKYHFDEVEEISEQGGYFIVPHIAGITLFDKRDVESVEKE
jgi:hypothetical protein